MLEKFELAVERVAGSSTACTGSSKRRSAVLAASLVAISLAIIIIIISIIIITTRTTTTSAKVGLPVHGRDTLLVVGGVGEDPTEVLSLNGAESVPSGERCGNLGDFPRGPSSGLVAFLVGSTHTACGGGWSSMTRDCYSLDATTKRWTKADFQLGTPRGFASSSTIPGGGIWVAGGKDGSNSLSTTEIISVGHGGRTTVKAGPNLPNILRAFCMLPLDGPTGFQRTIIIGGHTVFGKDKSQTHIYDWTTKQWSSGPTLLQRRQDHSCAWMTDSKDGKRKIVVAAGYTHGSYYISSVELLAEGGSEWTSGPSLPKELFSASMVTTADGAVVIIGGAGNYGMLSDLYRLESTSQGWKKMGVELEKARQYHAALIVPQLFCDKN